MAMWEERGGEISSTIFCSVSFLVEKGCFPLGATIGSTGRASWILTFFSVREWKQNPFFFFLPPTWSWKRPSWQMGAPAEEKRKRFSLSLSIHAPVLECLSGTKRGREKREGRTLAAFIPFWDSRKRAFFVATKVEGGKSIGSLLCIFLLFSTPDLASEEAASASSVRWCLLIRKSDANGGRGREGILPDGCSTYSSTKEEED